LSGKRKIEIKEKMVIIHFISASKRNSLDKEYATNGE
jgi:hypothetical protein